jgi:hypothetical protein
MTATVPGKNRGFQPNTPFPATVLTGHSSTVGLVYIRRKGTSYNEI